MREIGWIEHGSVQDWDDIGLKLTWSKKASPSRRPWRVELAARGRLRWRVVLGCGSRAAAGGESRKEYGRGGKSGTRSEIPGPTFLLGTLQGRRPKKKQMRPRSDSQDQIVLFSLRPHFRSFVLNKSPIYKSGILDC